MELTSFQKKRLIFQNTKKLKGTKIAISSDLTEEQRKIQRSLRKHLYRIRQSTSDNCYIRGEKLYRNSKPYSIEELELDQFVEEKKPNSAPPTPTVNKISTKEVLEENEQVFKQQESRIFTSQYSKNKTNSTSNTPKGFSKDIRPDKQNIQAQSSTQAANKPRTRSKNQ